MSNKLSQQTLLIKKLLLKFNELDRADNSIVILEVIREMHDLIDSYENRTLIDNA